MACNLVVSVFTKPVDSVADYCLVAQDCILFCVQKQDRVLPSSIVKAELEQKIAKEQGPEGLKLSKKKIALFKEEVISKLLPQAFIQKKNIYGYFDFARACLSWIPQVLMLQI